MATVDYTSGQAVIPVQGLGKVYMIEKVLDFSETNAAASTVVQALNVKAKTHVMNVWCEVVTAEGGTSTATVGSDTGANNGDVDGFDADLNLNASAGTITCGVGGTDAYVTAGGNTYTTEDTIDLVLSANAVDTAVIKVSALCIDLS